MSVVICDRKGLADFDDLFGDTPIPSNYEAHIHDVINKLNEVKLFTEAGISFSLPKEVKSNNSIDNFDSLETGRIYPNVIQAFEGTLKRIKKNQGGKSYCFYLPTNCGKTTYSNIIQFFAPPIIGFLTNRKYFPIRLIPNKCSGEVQTDISYKVFRELYGEIRVNDAKGRSFSLNVLEAKMRLEAIDNDENIIRCSTKNRDLIIKNAINEIYGKGKEGHALFISDEPSHGSNNKGVLDTILGLSKDLYNESEGDIFIGTDATPFELLNNSNIELILGNLYGNYCGLNCINGGYCDPNFPNLECPKIKTLKAFGKEVGLENDLSIIFPSYYKDVSAFRRHMEQQEKRLEKGKEPPKGILIPHGTTWVEYKKLCEDGIVEFLEYVALHPGEKPGILIRFVTHNDLMDHNFIEIIRRRLDGKIQLLKFFGQKLSFREFLKDRNCNQRLPYVVFVTAGCRMGDDCPNSIGYALEFCISNTTRAVLQGLFGRICGPNKGNPPAIYVGSSENVDILEDYISSKGKNIKNSNRSETIKDDSSTWTVSPHETNCPTCRGFLRSLENKVNESGQYSRKIYKGFGFNVTDELESFKHHAKIHHHQSVVGMNDETVVMYKDKNTGVVSEKTAKLKRDKNGLPFFSIYKMVKKEDQRSNARNEATGKEGEVFPVIWVSKDESLEKIAIEYVKFRIIQNKNDGVTRGNERSTFSKNDARIRGEEAAKNGRSVTSNPHPANTLPFHQWNEGWNTWMERAPKQAAS
jgi:hypothetical protein